MLSGLILWKTINYCLNTKQQSTMMEKHNNVKRPQSMFYMELLKGQAKKLNTDLVIEDKDRIAETDVKKVSRQWPFRES